MFNCCEMLKSKTIQIKNIHEKNMLIFSKKTFKKFSLKKKTIFKNIKITHNESINR